MHLILMVCISRESTETLWRVWSCWLECNWEIHWCCTQHWQLFYMYCMDVIYIIYIGFYNACENLVGTVVE